MLETGTSSNRRTPSTRLMTREGISLLRAASTTWGVTSSTYVKCLESNLRVESAPPKSVTSWGGLPRTMVQSRGIGHRLKRCQDVSIAVYRSRIGRYAK